MKSFEGHRGKYREMEMRRKGKKKSRSFRELLKRERGLKLLLGRNRFERKGQRGEVVMRMMMKRLEHLVERK